MWPSFGRQDGNCRQAGVLSRAATSTCTPLPAGPFLRAHLFLGLSLLCCALLPSHPINKCTQGFCFPGALASRADALQQRFVSTDCVQLLYLEFLVYRGPSRWLDVSGSGRTVLWCGQGLSVPHGSPVLGACRDC